MEKNKLLGKGWQFPPYFDYYNKSVGTVDGSESIRESLKILLTTRPGERSAAPQYGCDLTPLAFEALSLNLETFMINNIKQAILDYEKRVHVDNVTLTMKDHLEGIIRIKIHFTVKETGEVDYLTYDYSA